MKLGNQQHPATRKMLTLLQVMKPVKNSIHTAWPSWEKISHYLSPDTICLVIIRRLSNRDEGYI